MENKEPLWLSRPLLDTVQFELIRLHGGTYGIENENSIREALVAPKKRWEEGETNLFALAAVYVFSLNQKKGYISANQRLALLALYIFLSLNGWELDASNTQLVGILSQIDSQKISEEEFASWISSHVREKKQVKKRSEGGGKKQKPPQKKEGETGLQKGL